MTGAHDPNGMRGMPHDNAHYRAEMHNGGATRRSGHNSGAQDAGGHDTGHPAGRASAVPQAGGIAMTSESLHTISLDQLIATRDRFLSECFDIESGRRFVIDAQDADDRLGYLRRRIEEIHEELARRDLEKQAQDNPRTARAPLNGGDLLDGAPAPAPAPAPARRLDTSDMTAEAQSYLLRTNHRMDLLDELAGMARDKGDIEQAIQCTIEAQRLDRERVSFLERHDMDDPYKA